MVFDLLFVECLLKHSLLLSPLKNRLVVSIKTYLLDAKHRRLRCDELYILTCRLADWKIGLTTAKVLLFNNMSRSKSSQGSNRPRRKFTDLDRERRSKRRLAGESSGTTSDGGKNPRNVQSVERLLAGIGVPNQVAFKPDEFQLEALAAIENEDVLVTAPTGSGKTWIAREEIRRLVSQQKRVWYTTPLKALTNSKYVEFSNEFGSANVGILTGDRKENSGAPIIVGTTEIYRNQLFDALRGGEQVRTDLVVLDEAHYLADEDRGHVWEESIILTPPRIRLLLLSATVGKADELARWIESVRGSKVRVINRAGTRPVELRAAYLSSDLALHPLFDESGDYNQEIDRFSRDRNRDFERKRNPDPKRNRRSGSGKKKR